MKFILFSRNREITHPNKTITPLVGSLDMQSISHGAYWSEGLEALNRRLELNAASASMDISLNAKGIKKAGTGE